MPTMSTAEWQKSMKKRDKKFYVESVHDADLFIGLISFFSIQVCREAFIKCQWQFLESTYKPKSWILVWCDCMKDTACVGQGSSCAKTWSAVESLWLMYLYCAYEPRLRVQLSNTILCKWYGKYCKQWRLYYNNIHVENPWVIKAQLL